jgi:hypothetical protein
MWGKSRGIVGIVVPESGLESEGVVIVPLIVVLVRVVVFGVIVVSSLGH